MRIFLFALILIALLASSTDEARAQPGQTGSIAGTVVTREGGRPVTGATVVVEGRNLTAVANGVGRFRLDGVPAGQAVVIVDGPGLLQLRVPDVRFAPTKPCRS